MHPNKRGKASKVFLSGCGRQPTAHFTQSSTILNTSIFFLSLASFKLGHWQKEFVWFLSVFYLCVYLGATHEMPRHVCLALFILLRPTPSLPLLASSCYPHPGLASFDSMRNKTLMEMSLMKVSTSKNDGPPAETS